MKRVIFIAGPYRGANAWQVEQNIQRAEAVAFEVTAMGGIALCPHTMYRNFDKTLTDDVWLENIRELLRRSDGAYFQPGYENSEGSVDELEHAFQNDVHTFFTMAEVEEYINGL